ncbi:MAG: ThiF family adenylyltransferase [bacterium]|nr:ThiF family adenylyltransferase [bacterium]
MNILFERLQELSIKDNDSSLVEPLIFDLSIEGDQKKVDELIEAGKVRNVIDSYQSQFDELVLIRNPHALKAEVKENNSKSKVKLYDGKWVYFPWTGKLVHILDERDYYELHTSRNKLLITQEEQDVFKNSLVGFVGLNVGNSAATCVALEGGCENMKFADNDEFSMSNLNRFRASISNIGINKATLTAQQVYEINPYGNIDIFDSGLNEENIEKFLLEPKLDIIVEEMDALKLKIKIRELAKENKIPVIMVTGNGSNIIIDIERYDIEVDLEILNGHLKPDVMKKIISPAFKKSDLKEFTQLCKDFVGEEYLVDRLKESFDAIGKSIIGIPQLAECSLLRGAVLTYFIRGILNKKDVPSGRYTFNMDQII